MGLSSLACILEIQFASHKLPDAIGRWSLQCHYQGHMDAPSLKLGFSLTLLCDAWDPSICFARFEELEGGSLCAFLFALCRRAVLIADECIAGLADLHMHRVDDRQALWPGLFDASRSVLEQAEQVHDRQSSTPRAEGPLPFMERCNELKSKSMQKLCREPQALSVRSSVCLQWEGFRIHFAGKTFLRVWSGALTKNTPPCRWTNSPALGRGLS